MSSATFASAAAGAPPPDPSKHVKFTQGMVLGVDDFDQEFAYLSNRDQWLARDTIGYGTVCGLRVGLEKKDGDFEVSVWPGVAINPRGQLIRVAPRQCASLGTWLSQQNPAALGLTNDSPVTAYIVLCYRDCPTDQVPVPGEPCRCDTDTMAPSRIIDDFRLELTLTKPPQLEEDAVRDFMAWLREIEVADFNPAQGDLRAFLQAIRDAVGGITSPPESPPPDYFYGSPPAGLRIPRSRFCEWMRAAMRLWVTELRPFWQAQCAPQKACGCSGPCGCHGTGVEPDNMACDCLLLAELWITRSGGVATDARLDQERRPFLVHLRMLEELMLCGPCCGETGTGGMPETLAGDVNGPIGSNIVEGIQGFPVEISSPPTSDSLLGFDGTKWHLTAPSSGLPPASVPQPSNAIPSAETFGSVGNAGSQIQYSRADHVHPMPALPPVPKPATVVPGAENFGTAAIVGVSADYARADHLHQMPALPPLPQPSSVLPASENFGASGKIGTSLDYARADHIHAMPANAVEHPEDRGDYLIVAAGILNPGGSKVAPSYNQLAVSKPPAPGDNTVLLFFPDYKPPTLPPGEGYIVKGTSLGAQPATFHVLDFVKDGFHIQYPSDSKVSFMIEISMFFPPVV